MTEALVGFKPVDHVVELDLLYGSSVHSLRDQVLEEPVIEKRFQVIESFLMSQARRNLEPDVAIEFALREILNASQMYSIKDLADKIGITQKHLITKFDRIVGLTPKLFTRIAKFQKVIQTIGHRQRIEWSSVAYACGYYDQSHFIRDFVHFSGLNPSEYLVERGDHLNTISIRNS